MVTISCGVCVCGWVFGGGCVSSVYEIRQLIECVHRSSSRTLVFGRPSQNDETNFIYTKNQLTVVVRGHNIQTREKYYHSRDSYKYEI